MKHPKLFNIIVLISLLGLVLSAGFFNADNEGDGGAHKVVDTDKQNQNPFALTKKQDEERMTNIENPSFIRKLIGSATSFWTKTNGLTDSHSTVVSSIEKKDDEKPSTIDEFYDMHQSLDTKPSKNEESAEKN